MIASFILISIDKLLISSFLHWKEFFSSVHFNKHSRTNLNISVPVPKGSWLVFICGDTGLTEPDRTLNSSGSTSSNQTALSFKGSATKIEKRCKQIFFLSIYNIWYYIDIPHWNTISQGEAKFLAPFVIAYISNSIVYWTVWMR